MSEMASIRLKYLCRSVSRHGRERFYVRLPGKPMVRLPDDFTDPAFMEAYREAVEGTRKPGERPQAGKVVPGSFRELCLAYMGSVGFSDLGASTRAQRRNVIESMCLEPVRPGAAKIIGDGPAKAIDRRVVEVLRDRKAGKREAANHRLKTLSQIFTWGKRAGLVSHDPTTDVSRFRKRGTGHHVWSLDEVETYLAIHGPGTRARLALGLLLFTGVRISDLARIGPQHVRDSVLSFTPYKGRERNPKRLHLPILPDLQDILDTSPVGALAFLMTEAGQPFSIKGLGQWFRKRCDEAGLKHCSAHGLRKAGATIAAERGATAHQLMAIFGWSSLKEAEHYTREADRRRLAKEAMPFMGRGKGGG